MFYEFKRSYSLCIIIQFFILVITNTLCQKECIETTNIDIIKKIYKVHKLDVSSSQQSKVPCIYSGKINKIFYLFVISKEIKYSNNLIIWINGGPGNSSLYNAFHDNGPFLLNDNKVLLKNRSWTNAANIIYLDFPLGTGYSTIDYNEEIENKLSKKSISESFNSFVNIFLNTILNKEKLIEKIDKVILAGEGEAGLFLPSLLLSYNNYVLSNDNNNNNDIYLNKNYLIKHLILLSPVVDKRMQNYNRINLIDGLGIVNETEKQTYYSLLSLCNFKSNDDINQLRCPEAEEFLKNITGYSSIYDIRYPSYHYDRYEQLIDSYISDLDVLVSLNIFSANHDLHKYNLKNSKVKYIIEKLYHSSIEDLLTLIYYNNNKDNYLKIKRVLENNNFRYSNGYNNINNNQINLKVSPVNINFISGQFDIYSPSSSNDKLIYDYLNNSVINDQYLDIDKFLWKVKSTEGDHITLGYITQISNKFRQITLRNSGYYVTEDKDSESLIILINIINDKNFDCASLFENEVEKNSSSSIVQSKVNNNEECYLSKYKCNLLNNCNNNGKCKNGICYCNTGYTGVDCRYMINELNLIDKLVLLPKEIKVFLLPKVYINEDKSIVISAKISNEKEAKDTNLKLDIALNNSNTLIDSNNIVSSYSMTTNNIEIFVNAKNSENYYLIITNNNYNISSEISLETHDISVNFIKVWNIGSIGIFLTCASFIIGLILIYISYGRHRNFKRNSFKRPNSSLIDS